MNERQAIHGTELYRWKEEDGRLHRVHTSLGEVQAMADNRRIQAEGGGRKLAWGRACFRMTLAQYHSLIKKYPGLASPDQSENARAWERLARDPDYRDIVIGKP